MPNCKRCHRPLTPHREHRCNVSDDDTAIPYTVPDYSQSSPDFGGAFSSPAPDPSPSVPDTPSSDFSGGGGDFGGGGASGDF